MDSRRIPEFQIQVVRDLVQGQGMKAKAILECNMPALANCKRGRIQWIIRRAGLADPKRVKRLTPEQKQELVTYVSEHTEEPGPAVATKFGVDMRTVSRLRIKMFGKSDHNHRVAPDTEKQRRKDISRFYARKREELYNKLCSERAKLQVQLNNLEPRACNVCNEEWYWALPFFRNSSQRRADGSAVPEATCTICRSEMAILKRLGKTPDEIKQIMHNLVWMRPIKTVEQLTGQFRHDTAQRCMDPLANCHTCKKQWYHNGNYFHVNGTNGGRKLLHICQACPAKRSKRKFFSL